MFAGMPGTGIGAIFYALVALYAALKRLPGMDLRLVTSSVWVLATMLIVYSGAWTFYTSQAIGLVLLRAASPLILLAAVLGAAGLYALIKRHNPRHKSR